MSCTTDSCVLPNSRTEKRALSAPNPATPKENFNDLRNFLLSISQWYSENQWDVAQIEDSLHDAWDMLVQTSKITPATSPEQDRLVVLVSSTKELGILHRKEKDKMFNEDKKAAILSNGQSLWIDLPYLAEEMQRAWVTESTQYTTTERANFAVFSAKLCVVGICETELSPIALWLLKETLEVERPLSMDLEDDLNITENKDVLSVNDLLPACFAWLSTANFKLVKLAAQNYDPASSMTIKAGHPISTDRGILATKAKVTEPGFSLARWVFWRLRLKELSRCENEVIAKLAQQSFDEMIHTGIVLGIDVHGEKNYFDKVHEALHSEFTARGMIGSVDTIDINISMDWAD